jgi:hypothetical protein
MYGKQPFGQHSHPLEEHCNNPLAIGLALWHKCGSLFIILGPNESLHPRSNGLVPRFTEHKVNQCTQHHVDATLVMLASVYTSLDDMDWNIMVPMTVNQTWTGTIVANFHKIVEMSDKVRTADTFSDYIATLPEHICRLLMHYEFTPGGERTLKACL